MNKILTIAGREYNAAVRTKSFVISLVLLPMLIGGSAGMQLLLKDHVDVRDKRFAIVDRSPNQSLAQALLEASTERNERQIVDPTSGRQARPRFVLASVAPSSEQTQDIDRQRFELSEQVRRGELDGFLEIGSLAAEIQSTQAAKGAGASDATIMRYQSDTPTYDAFFRWAEPVVNEAVRQIRYRKLDLPAEKIQAVWRPVSLMNKGLTQRNAATGQIGEATDQNMAASILIPGGLVVLMFMLILVGATPLMQGVVEEKMQRIAEVLLGSVHPFQLMAGKLLGLVGVSATLGGVYLSGAYWALRHFGYAHFLTPDVLIWFLVYQILGVLLYGAMFIAVGAACSDLRETQTMLWPVMIVAMAPMFVWLQVVREPNSAFSTIASFVPTATPMLMLVRQAVPPGVPAWQPVVGVCGVLATTVITVYLAGRVFRVGLLMQGRGANLRDLLRWMVRG